MIQAIKKSFRLFEWASPTLKINKFVSAYYLEPITSNECSNNYLNRALMKEIGTSKDLSTASLSTLQFTETSGKKPPANLYHSDLNIPLEIDYTGVEAEDMEAARVLFETVGEVLGRAVRGELSVRAGFYELGGNSLNSIYTITRLRDKGYYIEISDFLKAANLGDVLSYLTTDPGNGKDSNEPKFSAEPMRDEHKQQVIDMIVLSFYEKAELEQILKNEMEIEDYAKCIDACWAALLHARLSVILKDVNGTPVAVALNFDARDEPEIELSGGLAKIMGFLEFVESSVRDTMLPGGKGTVLHSFMMATAPWLSARDNVAAILALENASVRLARDRAFKGVFTTNTSPLTQQLGTDVLGFKTLLDYQINQYVDSNGDRIFGKAPDDMRAIVCWKPID